MRSSLVDRLACWFNRERRGSLWYDGYVPAAWPGMLVQGLGEFFYSDGALLEVRFARNGVEGPEGHSVGVSLGEVKGHEDLSGGDDAGDSEFEIADAAAARDYVDAIVGLEAEEIGVGWVHLQPRVGNHTVEHLDLRGFGAGVPVLDGATGVEDEGEFFVGLFDEGQAGNDVEGRLAGGSGEDAVLIEAVPAPLDATLLFDLLPGEVTVVAHAALRDALPLFECIVRGEPAGVEFVFDAEAFGEREEDVEVGSSFAGGRDYAIDFADAAFGVGVGAFLFAPDGGGKDKVREVAGGGRMEPVLDDEEGDAGEGLLKESEIGEGDGWIGGDEPEGFDLAADGGFDDVGVGQTARGGNAAGVDVPESG